MHKLPLLPLKNLVVFPEIISPIAVGRLKSLAAVKAGVEADRQILTVLQKDPKIDSPNLEDLYSVGTLSTISRVEQRNQGAQVIVQGKQRVRLMEIEETDDYSQIVYEPLETLTLDESETDPRVEALHRENLELAKEIANAINPEKGDQIFQQFVGQINDPIVQMYRIASGTPNMTIEERQAILDIDDTETLMNRIHETLTHEQSVTEIQKEIQVQAREGVDQQQREHLLRQQKRAIEQALGEEDGDEEISELKADLKNAHLPENAQK